MRAYSKSALKLKQIEISYRLSTKIYFTNLPVIFGSCYAMRVNLSPVYLTLYLNLT